MASEDILRREVALDALDGNSSAAKEIGNVDDWQGVEAWRWYIIEENSGQYSYKYRQLS